MIPMKLKAKSCQSVAAHTSAAAAALIAAEGLAGITGTCSDLQLSHSGRAVAALRRRRQSSSGWTLSRGHRVEDTSADIVTTTGGVPASCQSPVAAVVKRTTSPVPPPRPKHDNKLRRLATASRDLVKTLRNHRY